MIDYILCYVEDNTAFFTNKTLSEQWGDDWDDAPYEHNAGNPYEHEPGQILTVMYRGPYITPCWGCWGELNSRYSVEMINRGDIAWLRPDFAPLDAEPILAGDTFGEFVRKMRKAGGTVFVEYRETSDD